MHLLFERLWYPFKNAMQGQGLSKDGLGFQGKQRYECAWCLVSVIGTSEGKNEDSIEDIVVGHLVCDIKLKDAPPEFGD